ncbi:hypothetical protein BB561_000794 [Smittium simulii]|uniref:PH domain-containing protein n=1 Tax=Smittium simulii TaxID=133385 RepID=A0A2T9YXN1_9FUNG|nr:hypothetical protein BB561_000794 [Smittium simulii]
MLNIDILDLEKDITQEKEIEERFKKSIDIELEKIKRWEVEVVKRIKGVIKEYYTFKIDELNSEKVIFSQSQEKLDSFNYENEWNKFETKVRGDLARHTSINKNHHKKIAKIEASNKDIMEYIAEGPIKMKTGIIKTFKVYYAVLTSGLFLNIYKTQKSFQMKELPVQSLLVSVLDLIHKDEKGVYTIYNKDSKMFSSSKSVLGDTLDTPILHTDIGLIEKDKIEQNSKISWYVILYETMVKGRENGVGRATLKSSFGSKLPTDKTEESDKAVADELAEEVTGEPESSEMAIQRSTDNNEPSSSRKSSNQSKNSNKTENAAASLIDETSNADKNIEPIMNQKKLSIETKEDISNIKNKKIIDITEDEKVEDIITLSPKTTQDLTLQKIGTNISQNSCQTNDSLAKNLKTKKKKKVNKRGKVVV